MVYARRTDANQTKVIKLLREAGFSVFSLSGVKQGVPDLLIAKDGYTALVEVKSTKGKLTPAQESFIGSWAGDIWIIKQSEEEDSIKRIALKVGQLGLG